VIQKFIVKHDKGTLTFFAEDELDAFKMAVRQGTEDIEGIKDVSDRRSSIRMYMRLERRKWIVDPPERK